MDALWHACSRVKINSHFLYFGDNRIIAEEFFVISLALDSKRFQIVILTVNTNMYVHTLTQICRLALTADILILRGPSAQRFLIKILAIRVFMVFFELQYPLYSHYLPVSSTEADQTLRKL